eukprot:CAMPEP_0197653504 /NCGR_PEP_ID=MMETSP1338-20131121/35819_1 /TAXON_ID=43686 ORGANISM="Pelagodinium beii, Strain RCC1491" /NCGR_SAMPLE_ID=MMETSP1338 /ASSEMBLY_ACC=CAM_ASM_000754 /LENGTH=656 /DNA_ID=CAMNT_0043228641 /DNA_START=75 /DNA_END=2045 /DNA_ORIENTATION=+
MVALLKRSCPPTLVCDIASDDGTKKMATNQCLKNPMPTTSGFLETPNSFQANAFIKNGISTGKELTVGPKRRVSVSNPDLTSKLCSMLPAVSLFGHYGAVVLTTLFFPSAAYLLSTFLTILVFLWVGNMAISSALGLVNMRRETSKDWNALVKTLPTEEVQKVHHVVILPNYMEHEAMLKETLENLGKSPMAHVMQVVLAMEGRERGSHEKAKRIIAEKKHLFEDVWATFHPAGLPRETAGKSSNTQWAFNETRRRVAVKEWDASLVFVSVADADSMFHPHYFSAITHQGLTMSKEERSWSIWQPPVLLFRNFFAVPSMTRVSSMATLIFELASLSNQKLFTAFAYSSYSTTMALATHQSVEGWDADVIAEDHHMFCKCWFGALWSGADVEQEKGNSNGIAYEIKPKVKLQPVFLPCLGYLVESSEGYFASLHARFKQARRHMQGIVELGYVVLQWIRLSQSVGFFRIPWRTHRSIALMCTKLHILHISSTAQVFSLFFVFFRGLFSLNMTQLIWHPIASLTNSWTNMSFMQKALSAYLGQMSFVMLLTCVTTALCVKDLMEGRYHQHVQDGENAKAPEAELTQCSYGDITGRRKKMLPGRMLSMLILLVLNDNLLNGYPSMAVYAVIPVILASWSLLRFKDFEYIVADKPEFKKD